MKRGGKNGNLLCPIRMLLDKRLICKGNIGCHKVAVRTLFVFVRVKYIPVVGTGVVAALLFVVSSASYKTI